MAGRALASARRGRSKVSSFRQKTTKVTSRKCFRVSLASLGIKAGEDAFTALEKNFVPITEDINTGEAFGEAARHLIGVHKPDLVWLDPLLSFIGDDISKQEVCSGFLRGMLNPIAHETGVSWMMVHHTPKPSTDPKSKSGWNTTDHSYAGTGSAELTNWARAVCLLRTTKVEGDYELLLAKRGKRAGATSFEGDRTDRLYLKHSDHSILWEQRPKPIIVVEEPKPKKTKEEIAERCSKAASKQIKDLDGLIDKIVVPMKKTQIYELAKVGGHGSAYLLRKDWSEIKLRLAKSSDGRFYNPSKYEEQTD